MDLKARTTIIECFEDGKRVDVFLSSALPDMSRSAVSKLLDTERVVRRGRNTPETTVLKSHRTLSGDIYFITQDEPELTEAIPQSIPLIVVYEDSDIIVINKPKGLVTHPAPGHPDGTLVNALLAHCGDSLSGVGGIKRPGIVHRLDKDTSGLIIAAKNDFAHVSLSRQLSSRMLTRKYDAILCGMMKNDSGTIKAPIGRCAKNRKRQSITYVNSREAITHYTVLARYSLNSGHRHYSGSGKLYTHIKCRLETGRTHQIRVHMAYLGFPILGDMLYGRKKTELGMSSQCLHASELRFIHPTTKNELSFESPLPDYFTEVLSKLRLVDY